MTAFTISYIILWMLVLTLAGGLLLLFRYHGRQLMMSSAGREEQGPPVGSKLRAGRVDGVNGLSTIIGQPTSHNRQVVVWLSATCAPCLEAWESLKNSPLPATGGVEVVALFRGRPKDVVPLAASAAPGVIVVADTAGRLTRGHHVGTVPFGAVLDDSGRLLEMGPGSSASFVSHLLTMASREMSMASRENAAIQ
jgi:hypothetical protein